MFLSQEAEAARAPTLASQQEFLNDSLDALLKACEEASGAESISTIDKFSRLQVCVDVLTRILRMLDTDNCGFLYYDDVCG